MQKNKADKLQEDNNKLRQKINKLEKDKTKLEGELEKTKPNVIPIKISLLRKNVNVRLPLLTQSQARNGAGN